MQIDFSDRPLPLDSVPGLLPTHLDQRYCLRDMAVLGVRPYWTTEQRMVNLSSRAGHGSYQFSSSLPLMKHILPVQTYAVLSLVPHEKNSRLHVVTHPHFNVNCQYY